jgi:hypothetical protein
MVARFVGATVPDHLARALLCLGVRRFTLAPGRVVDRLGHAPFFVVPGAGEMLGAVLLWTLVRKPR